MTRSKSPYCNPHKIKKEIDAYVLGQERGTKAIAMAVAQHLIATQHPDGQTDNVILIGPTGCGKTETFRCLQRLETKFGCPVLMVNVLDYAATKSWQGDSITEIFAQVIERAASIYDELYYHDECMEKQKASITKIANRAIVLLDEFDKISLCGDGKSRQFMKEYQSNLLKIIEGNTYDIGTLTHKRKVSKNGGSGYPIENSDCILLTDMTVDTTNMLFIALGAFEGLERITTNRLEQEQYAKDFRAFQYTNYQNTYLGFLAQPHPVKTKPISYTYEQLIPSTEDLIEYGFMRELIGRITIRAVYKPLNEDALIDIMLHAKSSAYKDFQRKFRSINHDLRCSRSALREIARIAIQRGTGARGLRSVFNELLSDTWYDLADDTRTKLRLLLRGTEIREHRPPLLHVLDREEQNKRRKFVQILKRPFKK